MPAAPAFRRTLAASTLALVGTMGISCGIVPSTAPTPGTAAGPADLALCVDETNSYRARAGLPPLTRSPELETFASDAARYDATAGAAHGYFKRTNGSGISRAEIELLWWHNYTIGETLAQGLAQMWQGGPGSEHYDIIAGPYSEIGCGIYVNGPDVSIAQDFR